MKPVKNILFLAIVGSVAACGGGGGDGSTTSGPSAANSATVSAFLTDNLAVDYSEVWVTVYSVTAENAASQTVTVFDDAAGKVVNLATLVNIGELLNTITLPVGRYDDFTVTLANTIQLVSKTGVTSTASFGANGDHATIRVDGDLNVASGQATSFALDFDLAQFTLNPATGVVTPVVVYKDRDDVSRFSSSTAEIEGVIQSAGNGSFTIVPRNSGVAVTVNYDSATLLYDDETRRILTDTSTLAPGVRVEVDGDFDQSRLILTASRISFEDESASSSDPSANRLMEVEGVVQSFDGSTLVVDVRDADFLPPANALTIANVTNAAFHDSSLAQLQSSGQWVELKGLWDGSSFTAVMVEIETESDDSSAESDDDSDSDDLR